MKKPHSNLRAFRVQHNITQSDVAYLLNLKNSSNISRYENGDRSPTVDVILAYHLLFDTQLGSFFADRRAHIKARIISRIKPLLTQIENEPTNLQTHSRITFLKAALTRLNQSST